MEENKIIDSSRKEICESIINGNISDTAKLFKEFGVENGNYNGLLKKLAEKETVEGEETYKFKLPRAIRYKMFLYCYNEFEKSNTDIKLDEAIILLEELNELTLNTDYKNSPKIIISKLNNTIKREFRKNNSITYLNLIYDDNDKLKYGKKVYNNLINKYKNLLKAECRNSNKEIFDNIPAGVMREIISSSRRLKDLNTVCTCLINNNSYKIYESNILNRYNKIFDYRSSRNNSSSNDIEEIPQQIKTIIITNFVRKTNFFDEEFIAKIIDNNFMNTFICLNAPEILDRYILLNPSNEDKNGNENNSFFDRLQKCMSNLCEKLPKIKAADIRSLRSEGGIEWKHSRCPSNEALKKLFEMMKAREYYINRGYEPGLNEKLKEFEEYLGINSKGTSNKLQMFANAFVNVGNTPIYTTPNGNIMIC